MSPLCTGQADAPQEAGRLHTAALAAIHAAAFPPNESWSATVFAAQLVQPGCFGLIDVSRIGGGGGMLMARVVADEAEIVTLAVSPASRRRGLGRRLLVAAMHRAAVMGARAMFLEVAASNAPAMALYARAGFTRAGFRPRYYANGEDALVLRAELAAPAPRAPAITCRGAATDD
jgi:[ribosomal protein S18]-alanine N-acetyltransferase